MIAALLRRGAAHVAVDAVDAGVERAADEPLRVRRLPVEHLRPRREPLELRAKPAQKRFGVALGARVDLRVAARWPAPRNAGGRRETCGLPGAGRRSRRAVLVGHGRQDTSAAQASGVGRRSRSDRSPSARRRRSLVGRTAAPSSAAERGEHRADRASSMRTTKPTTGCSDRCRGAAGQPISSQSRALGRHVVRVAQHLVDHPLPGAAPRPRRAPATRPARRTRRRRPATSPTQRAARRRRSASADSAAARYAASTPPPMIHRQQQLATLMIGSAESTPMNRPPSSAGWIMVAADLRLSRSTRGRGA